MRTVAIQPCDLAQHFSGKRDHIVVELRVSGPSGATNEVESEDNEVPPVTDEPGSFMSGFKKNRLKTGLRTEPVALMLGAQSSISRHCSVLHESWMIEFIDLTARISC